MKFLITGSNGLLGQKIIYDLLHRTGHDIIASSKGHNRISIKDGYIYEPLDITDENAVMQLVQKHQPDCIINTAAMTNVDACEVDKDGCKEINIDAVQYLVHAAEKVKAHIVHLSTDFVFDGLSGPYKEEDVPNPLSYYAWSKLDSERIVQSAKIKWAILRTIIIYGVVDDAQRSNVVLWTKSSLEQQKQINVISDQIRSPTLAEDLATACINAGLKQAAGIYHVSGKETMSILAISYFVADFFKLDKSYIKPVTTAELNQAAKRPLVTGFIIDKAIRELDYHPHSLAEGLAIVAEQLSKKVSS